MLKLENVTVCLGEKEILKNINLDIDRGQLHAIIGDVHSGKSSLAHFIARWPEFSSTSGHTYFKGKNIDKDTTEDLYKKGLFITFQRPPEFEFVKNGQLVSKKVKTTNYKKHVKLLGLDEVHEMLLMTVSELGLHNMKKNELLQVLLHKPKMVIFDEIDQDIDPVDYPLISNIIKLYLDNSKSIVVLSSNVEFLKLLEPDRVHVLVEGKIAHSGDKTILERIYEDGNTEFH